MTELLVLGGERVAAADDATTEVVEPSTGKPAWEVARASPEDARRAVDVAVDAFETGPWRRMSARERGHILTKASFLIRERAEELATLEARNGGKPIGGARAEIDIVANTYEYWGGAANKIFGETIPIVPPGLDVTLREPVGPCVLISPWNFPAVIANWKTAPALACGNTAILKPASQTPLTALAIADLLMEAGLPEGTLSVLPGPGSTTATALITDPRIAKIGFTGSTEVGKKVMETAAGNITRVSLELGGKSANVVFEDADLDVAIPKSLWSVFDNAGQDCCARSRQFVQRPIYDEYVERFSKATEAIGVGDPLDEATEMGPLISQGQRQTALDYLAIGQEEGGRLTTGGDAARPRGLLPDAPPCSPTSTTPGAWLARRSSVRSCASCRSTPRRRRSASRTTRRTGCPAPIWTRDIGRAIRVAKAIRTGVISVNSSSSVFTEAPFGGYKQSGIGREMGMHAAALYTEVKNIYFSEE